MAETSLKAPVEQFYSALKRLDAEAITRTCTPDAVFTIYAIDDPIPVSGQFTGHEAIKQHFVKFALRWRTFDVELRRFEGSGLVAAAKANVVAISRETGEVVTMEESHFFEFGANGFARVEIFVESVRRAPRVDCPARHFMPPPPRRPAHAEI